jgi:hypothetical protein
MFGGMFVIVLLCVLGFVLYFLPSFIAWNKRNSGAIIALNILLGWTFVGWVVALVWSLTADQPTVVLMQSRCSKYYRLRRCFAPLAGSIRQPHRVFAKPVVGRWRKQFGVA